MLCPWDDNDLLIVAKKTPVPDTETPGVGGEGVKRFPKQCRILLLLLVAFWNLRYCSLAEEIICIGPGA